MANNQGVVVRRNMDDSLIQARFGNELAKAQSNSILQAQREMMEDEDLDTYIPRAGLSTRRGSRPVRNTPKNPNAAPTGSVADIVQSEIIKHPEIRDPRYRGKIKYGADKLISNMINKIDGGMGLSQPIAPPTQEQSIPKEYEAQMKYNYIPRETHPHHVPHDEFRQQPTMTTHPNPRQYPTEDIPSHNPPPPPPFIPPVEHKPVQVTESMIVPVLGYNETNIELLSRVSENVAKCSKVLAEINNTTKPLNVEEMMRVLEFMDNSTFRKILGEAFNETLQKNLQLSTKITSYLNSTAVIDDTKPIIPEPLDDNHSASDSGETPVNPSQNTSDQSVSSNNQTDTKKNVSSGEMNGDN